MKKCKKCKKEKLIQDFSFKNKAKNITRSYCRVCQKKYDKQYNESFEGQQVRIKYNLSPERQFYRYKIDAKRRNYQFDLTFDDFLSFEGKPCFYCGILLKKISIDRSNNNIGYIMENLVPCCSNCNFLKGKVENKELFLDYVLRIAEYQKVKHGK